MYKLPALIMTTMILTTFSLQAQNPKRLSVDLKKGNLLSIIEPISNKGEKAESARKRYYDVAINLAQSYGYQNRAALRVTDTLIGAQGPKVFVLASWPDEQADATFESLPQWQEYKALRPVIWESLKFYKSPTLKDISLQFDPNLSYTVSFAWFEDEGEQGFTEYREKTRNALLRAGGRQIHQMIKPRFDTHSAPFDGPDVVTLVEWQNENSIEDYQQTDEYKSSAHLLKTNTRRFDLYRIEPVIR